jgi:hypothetical protein
MRKLISAGVAVILAATLAGCAPARTGSDDTSDPVGYGEVEILTKTLSDGRILECAYIFDRGDRSGFDCNWEGVTAQRELLGDK